MTARGVLFAITADDLGALDASNDAAERVEYIVEVIEQRWEAGFVLEVDAGLADRRLPSAQSLPAVVSRL